MSIEKQVLNLSYSKELHGKRVSALSNGTTFIQDANFDLKKELISLHDALGDSLGGGGVYGDCEVVRITSFGYVECRLYSDEGLCLSYIDIKEVEKAMPDGFLRHGNDLNIGIVTDYRFSLIVSKKARQNRLKDIKEMKIVQSFIIGDHNCQIK